jgi:hypothetical protein
MIAKVNPFTRTVIVTEKDTTEEVVLEFTHLDDIADFVFGGLHFEAQFLYEDSFTFHVFGINMDGYMDYTNNLIKKIIYEF